MKAQYGCEVVGCGDLLVVGIHEDVARDLEAVLVVVDVVERALAPHDEALEGCARHEWVYREALDVDPAGCSVVGLVDKERSALCLEYRPAHLPLRRSVMSYMSRKSTSKLAGTFVGRCVKLPAREKVGLGKQMLQKKEVIAIDRECLSSTPMAEK
jgi:hypothetical protein